MSLCSEVTYRDTFEPVDGPAPQTMLQVSSGTLRALFPIGRNRPFIRVAYRQKTIHGVSWQSYEEVRFDTATGEDDLLLPLHSKSRPLCALWGSSASAPSSVRAVNGFASSLYDRLLSGRLFFFADDFYVHSAGSLLLCGCRRCGKAESIRYAGFDPASFTCISKMSLTCRSP